MPQKKIKVRGVLIAQGSILDKRIPTDPGIWDHDETCGSATRHMVRLSDGRLFDLGNAGIETQQVELYRNR